MGVKVNKVSLKDLHNRQKSIEELTQENEELRQKVTAAETQLTDTQLALCEVYELILGGV
ncbi:hypothetical protein B5G12_00070 [Faecalibacterium sp. An58]|jgi:hypothetical protein|uniref:hypothetical protein n=1 Tax=unclassified Faecalibacterium TaxID=2646395 RepID=UPI000B37B0DD|nr:MULTISPECIES: hypothetical protein [unclassified Faecalibacterium]OUN75509.1 hypothetical protein B5G12_00070 [Faecalibacterium sp. An58]OUP26501.1 hypothetical protein B5F27_13230 [Faecalibacterium sp. An192]